MEQQEQQVDEQEAPAARPSPSMAKSEKAPTVPAHLMFVDTVEIGALCAVSELRDASISSGSDQRISCTLPDAAAADGRVPLQRLLPI